MLNKTKDLNWKDRFEKEQKKTKSLKIGSIWMCHLSKWASSNAKNDVRWNTSGERVTNLNGMGDQL